ncbi:glycoside hydrolase family 28 [Opitutaceae bacterium TAV4]|nr:glycoside hydrolase family 28 [Opitutaceae bacterium TAV4]RRJ99109.1 glycoside hydrolase family 28 [Opitutaceae bacterium TAV3]
MRISISDTGAIASDSLISTKAIQDAINRCAEAGGGVVYCPPGKFLTGTLWLKDNITLYLESGCTLMACGQRSEYNAADCFPEQDLVAHQAADGTHLLIAYKCRNVTISGRGTIHGNHLAFFTEGVIKADPAIEGAHDHYKMPVTRPGQMLYFFGSTDIRIENISIINACFWSVYMLGCDSVKVSGVTIRTARAIPNADGLHFNCCRNLVVDNCEIDTADDCIVLRGHYKVMGANDMPSENVIVSNCILRTRCCAFRLGVGDGTLRNCLFSNIVIHDTRTGISIWPAYSHRYPRGTDMDNIRFENIVMDVAMPVFFILGEGSTATVGNITFQNMSCRATKPSCIIGEAGNHLSNIEFSNCVFRFYGNKKQALFDPDSYGDKEFFTEPPACGIFIRYTDYLRLRNVRLDWSKAEGSRSEAICCIDCEKIDVRDIDAGDFENVGIRAPLRLSRSSISHPHLPDS